TTLSNEEPYVPPTTGKQSTTQPTSKQEKTTMSLSDIRSTLRDIINGTTSTTESSSSSTTQNEEPGTQSTSSTTDNNRSTTQGNNKTSSTKSTNKNNSTGTTNKWTTTVKYTTTVKPMTELYFPNTQSPNEGVDGLSAYYERINSTEPLPTEIVTTTEAYEEEEEEGPQLSPAVTVIIAVAAILALTCGLTGIFSMRNKRLAEKEDAGEVNENGDIKISRAKKRANDDDDDDIPTAQSDNFDSQDEIDNTDDVEPVNVTTQKAEPKPIPIQKPKGKKNEGYEDFDTGRHDD
nr:hypothetical protein [Clostridiales bacterium]